MSIKYALYENRLTDDPNIYSARVKFTGSVDMAMLARRIVDQGSTVTMPDILAVMENMVTATQGYLMEGYRVNLGGLCELFPRLKGVFNGITDSYDPARHKIELGANPAGRIRSAFRENVSVARVEAAKPIPNLLIYSDLASGEVNGAVTPGGIGTIDGRRLKFDAANSDEGIFFVNTADNTEYKVSAVQRNMPSQLVFMVPAIAGGTELQLEVRAYFGEELRVGLLDSILGV